MNLVKRTSKNILDMTLVDKLYCSWCKRICTCTAKSIKIHHYLYNKYK